MFFVPDRHLGEVVAGWAGVPPDEIFVLGAGEEGARTRVARLTESERARLDRARMILWGSYCGVHTVFRPEHVRDWQARGYRVLVHPECPKPVVDVADGAGSTRYLWNEVAAAPPGSKIAIGTEGHFVRNAQEQSAARGVEVVNVADAPGVGNGSMGCGCATMSRNDPPHLVAILDLLRRGTPPDLNHVLAGDRVDEFTGRRERLPAEEREALANEARRALETMIEVTRAARS